ncbi:hypothetical protein D3C78_1148230 [compost metagenome]
MPSIVCSFTCILPVCLTFDKSTTAPLYTCSPSSTLCSPYTVTCSTDGLMDTRLVSAGILPVKLICRGNVLNGGVTLTSAWTVSGAITAFVISMPSESYTTIFAFLFETVFSAPVTSSSTATSPTRLISSLGSVTCTSGAPDTNAGVPATYPAAGAPFATSWSWNVFVTISSSCTVTVRGDMLTT